MGAKPLKFWSSRACIQELVILRLLPQQPLYLFSACWCFLFLSIVSFTYLLIEITKLEAPLIEESCGKVSAVSEGNCSVASKSFSVLRGNPQSKTEQSPQDYSTSSGLLSLSGTKSHRLGYMAYCSGSENKWGRNRSFKCAAPEFTGGREQEQETDVN